MIWTDDDPGAGDLGEIEARIVALSVRREHAEATEAVIRRGAAAMVDFWGGNAHDAWETLAVREVQGWVLMHSRLEAEQKSLSRYLSDVEGIAVRAARQKAILADATADLARAALTSAIASADELFSSGGVSPGDAAAREAQGASAGAHDVLAELAAERADADRRLISSLNRLDSDYATTTFQLAPVGLSAGEASSLSPRALLDLLGTLDPAQLQSQLHDDPGLTMAFWNAPPDPVAVASWWEGLSPAEQSTMVTVAPSIIGNLGGVPYAIRIDANNEQMAALKRDYDAGRLSGAKKSSYVALVRSLKASAANGVESGIIDLNFEAESPLAALAIGNLDTASKVTWAVPGMGSTVASMPGWARAAANLLSAQDIVDTSTHATVAWIGYRAPDMISASPSSVVGDHSVLRNHDARVGAERLAAELDAMHTRQQHHAAQSSTISIVGHSYGTTVSADALVKTKFDVESFTLAASAGIDAGVVPHASNMHVTTRHGAQQVFETLAAADRVAPTGQYYSGRIAPDHGLWGGQRFGSDGAGGLRGVQGHEAIGTGGSEGPFSTVDPGYGYLDLGTEALRNIAAASTGHPEEILDGVTTRGSLQGIVNGAIQNSGGPLGPLIGIR